MPATIALSTIDLAARAVGIVGSGCMLGTTYATSSVIIPMIFAESSLSLTQLVNLWNANFDLSVQRWLPVALLPGFLGYAVAAWNTWRLTRSTHTNRIGIAASKTSRLTSPSTSTSSSVFLYRQSAKVLGLAALTLFLFPVYTKAFIFPSVNKLKAIREQQLTSAAATVIPTTTVSSSSSSSSSSAASGQTITHLIQQWELRHRGRIALAALSFGLGLWDLLHLVSTA